jgi:hypothetical protein
MATQLPGRGPRGELAEALYTGEQKNVSFPGNIAQVDHWMAFRINSSFFRKKDDYAVKNDLKRIFLPLPAQLGTAYSQSYSSGGIGQFGDLGANEMGAAVANVVRGNTKEAIDSLVNQVTSNAKGAYDVAAKAGSQLMNGEFNNAAKTVIGSQAGQRGLYALSETLEAIPIAGGISKGALAAGNAARNPYLAMLYEGPTLRTHQFSWKLTAKNYAESVAIQEIIYLFKYHSSPGYATSGQDQFFEYPEQFDIDFHYEDYLYNIGPSACTAMEVNYHPDGVLYHLPPRTEASGRSITVENMLNRDSRATGSLPLEKIKLPVSVQLNLTFQEVAIVTKETIKSQNR